MYKNFMVGLFAIFTVIGSAQSEEYNFKLIYSPEYIANCQSVSDTNVYLQRSKRKLNFKILMNLSYDKTKKLVQNAEDYTFKIYSHKGKSLTIPEGKPLKTVAFSEFLDGSLKKKTILGYSLRLKIPKSIRKSARVDVDGIKFNSWNVLLVLENNITGEVLGLSIYNLQFLPNGLSFFEKIEGTSSFYSLPAVPDSILYDNSDRMDTLDVNRFFQKSVRESSETETLKGYGFGFDVGSNYNFSIVGSYYYDFFNSNYHSYTPVLDDIMIAFSAFDLFTKTTYVQVEKSHSIVNHFEVLPGSSAVIYEQAHVEEADYTKYGSNECGFLSELGIERKSMMRYSYHILEVDRTKYLEDQYIENIGNKYLPTYNFKQ